HPIDHLREQAAQQFQRTVAKRTRSLPEAAAAYRLRRGRHPPPAFDAWYRFAESKDAFVVEDFFDHIYDDLEPFWGVPAREIRAAAAGGDVVPSIVSVRNGTVSKTEDFWRINYWAELVRSVVDEGGYVPDVDMPVNNMDESRVLVPWEDVEALVGAAGKEGRITENSSAVLDRYGGFGDLSQEVPVPVDWIHDHTEIWSLFQSTCPPDSPARQNVEGIPDLSSPAADCMPVQYPEGSYEGYVSNWTIATDPCYHPHLRCLHGTFIAPISMATSKRLVPIFGGSKLVRNNEISIPAAMYWGDWQEYTGGDEHGIPWNKKTAGLVWRGTQSGGWNTAETWPHFHRHRFLSLLNGTKVSAATGQNDRSSLTFRLPPSSLYNISADQQNSSNLGPWISSLANAGFSELLCYPPEEGCAYAEPHFAVLPQIPMQAQYDYKLLPDIDGNSYSARFRAFLLSTSLPLKATIYREWHDSRLWPWLHFVPMDNSYVDLYGLVEYFLGGDGGRREAHDVEAAKMAMEGQEWARKVLRREDMQVYVHRLLLEYARVCRDERAVLGWVGDL
ncbi:glycosyltransferase family 90 protein, partial [Saccharata proteae CBS 121410]